MLWERGKAYSQDLRERIFAAWDAGLIAGLRHDGMVAPGVFDGVINGEMFLAYVEQVLVPTLRAGASPSMMVAMLSDLTFRLRAWDVDSI